MAPGRLEILGNHTDYNEGFVLSAAVDRATVVSLRKVGGKVCQLSSPAYHEGVIEFSLDEIDTPLSNKCWSNYIRGVVRQLQVRGYEIPAFQFLVISDIPLSAGMSSSSALEMALVTGLNELCTLDLTDQEKAKIGQATENDYIGANTGLMDQLTSISGKQGHLLLSEYRELNLQDIPLPQELSFVVINSGVKHDLSHEYNDRRKQCEKAVATLQLADSSIGSLRDVDLDTLCARQADLDPVDLRRALHVVSENSRVNEACKMLETGAYQDFGALLFDSHESSKMNFENSCEELDKIVDIAKASPLCLGARLSGGGFGGVTVHLVNDKDVEAYIAFAQHALEKELGHELEIFVCKSAQGATIAHSSG